jgi:hypothetical protein
MHCSSILDDNNLARHLVATCPSNWDDLVKNWEYTINQGYSKQAIGLEYNLSLPIYKNGKYVIQTTCGGRLFCHKPTTRQLIGQFFSQTFDGVLFAFFVAVETDGTLFCNLLAATYIPKVTVSVRFIDNAQFKFEFDHLQPRFRQTVEHNYSGITCEDFLPNFVESVYVAWDN